MIKPMLRTTLLLSLAIGETHATNCVLFQLMQSPMMEL